MSVDCPLEGGVVGEKVACFSSKRARISGYKASKGKKSKAMQEGKEETEGEERRREGMGAKGRPIGEEMTDQGNRALHMRFHKGIY